MKKRTLPIIILLSGLLLWGCYPDGPVYTEDMDVVITHHNPDYNFATKGTYAMPDSIVKITGNVQENQRPEWIPDDTADPILAQIAENMDALGWERVDYDADPAPDVLLLPAAWETTTIYYYYDYWYWWYGGYYPYYPPVYYGGSYTTGSLLMTIRDQNDLGANGNPISEWTGVLNGLLKDRFDPSRVLPLIDQAFDQSPYLKTN